MLSFHSYIKIFQYENKIMIFLQRFTVPDVSITAYAGFDEAYRTNAGLSMVAYLTLTRRYVPTGYSYPGRDDTMHLGF